ncbi:uncharacterized protein LOC141616955 isoform X2 [Silene latifolia]|uniref:uncharacterized protein LOC141616955 isoform X2 n=1 Tax=Silene latifolia TaxID=37657 RepID=UPI003D780C46
MAVMAAVSGYCTTPFLQNSPPCSPPFQPLNRTFSLAVSKSRRSFDNRLRIRCSNSSSSDSTGIQVYRDFERLVTETVKQSQDTWGGASNWREAEGAWVLGPRHSKPWSIVHFIGGIFVGAAPQLTYRLFLERLCEKGIMVIATPYASGFDHFSIADEVQFKFDRCLRSVQETVEELPTFGIGHSLGSVIHLLIGSRYAVQRNGNIYMAFNNKDPSDAIPLFSPVFSPVAQSLGPLLSQIASSPTIRLGAETTLKQLENISPPIMKQMLPLIEQLPPLYMDLVNGRDNFIPKPEETRRLALPDVPPAMADAVNRGGELLANLVAGTPWETVTRDVSASLGVDSQILRAETSKDLEVLVDAVTCWMSSSVSQKLLRR